MTNKTKKQEIKELQRYIIRLEAIVEEMTEEFKTKIKDFEIEIHSVKAEITRLKK